MDASLSPARWPDIDDQDLPAPESRARLALVRAMAIVAVLVGSGYLVWRTVATVPDASWWLAWPLLLLELHSMLTFLLYLHVLWHPGSVRPPRPVHVPRKSVTVLIPTYNEPAEVLLPTIAAAAALEQAQEVWVLDDGDRNWVRKLCASLGVVYRSRDNRDDAKAGNLNTALPDVTTDLVAVLDADHVARADFLAAVLGYFDDPDVALVQLPQSFYNCDSFEHMRVGRGLYCEQDLFYRLLAEGRNRWGAAFWCGTNSVVRVAALREVGGVATETVTEDIHTAIRLHRAGWKSVYHNEVLARGLAAANSEQYLNQRLRWGTGAMQVLRIENPLTVRGLRWHQRLSYASTLLGWFDSWRTLGFVLLPIAAVFTGALPAVAPMGTFLALFLAAWGTQRIALQMLGRGRAPMWPSTLFEFVRMPAALRATMTLASSRSRPFTVTDKGRTGKDRHALPVPQLLVVLLLVSLGSGIWYVATVLGYTPVTYQIPWVAHTAALWMLFNAAFLLGAAYRIRSERFGSERRAAVRFPVTGTMRVDGTTAVVEDVSVNGTRVVMPRQLTPGSRVWVNAVPLLPRAVQAKVRSSHALDSGWLVGLEFSDMKPQTRAHLVLELFQTGSTPALTTAGSPTPQPAATRPAATPHRREKQVPSR